MKIQKILSRNRRDFTAVYECETCGATSESYGYDDANFHANVIPLMPCQECGAKAPPSYQPLAPLYPEGLQV